jgi:HAE1 family hydrophobic/amphiphilic exporter-1
VAEVVEAWKEPLAAVRSKGRPVLAINAQKEVGANVIEVMAGIREAVRRVSGPGGVLEAEARRRGLAGPLRLEQVYDQTVYIDDALALVKDNIWLGGTLAFAVLLLSLGSVRGAVIIGLSIPISIVGAVVAMLVLGRTVNVVSLAGMAFATGMVVDNAIVVLENTFRHLELGKHPLRAAVDGAREVSGAVVASTLTTLVAFVPILLVREEAGQLFRDIALAICAAVGLSLVVSLTVIPTATARLLRHVPPAIAGGAGASGWASRAAAPLRAVPLLVAGGVRRMNRSLGARLAAILLLTAGSVAGTVWLRPPSDYLPTGNRNMVFGLIICPPGYNLERQEALAKRIEETVRPGWEGADRARAGADPAEVLAAAPRLPTFDFRNMAPGEPVPTPLVDNYFIVSFGGLMFHGAIGVDPGKVVDLVPLLTHATRAERVPGVVAFAFQVPLFRVGGSTGTAVKINFTGDDLDEVSAAALGAYLALVGAYGPHAVQPDPPNFNVPGPELQVVPDLARLAEAGMTPADLGRAVQSLGDGAVAGEYRIGGETVDLKVVTADHGVAGTLAALEDVPVATPRGGVVPLGSLARLRRVNAASQINRDGRRRSVTLQFTPPAGVPLEKAIADARALLDARREAGLLPHDVDTTYTGSASKLQAVRSALLGDGSAAGTLSSSLFLALLVTYLVMCVLFQSWLYPLVIMFSVPLATVGGFLALRWVHDASVADRYAPVQNLDVLTMLGFVILIGVVVNNAILIVHQARNFLRGTTEEGGVRLEPAEAIAESVRTRVRPIFMTTLTSVLGMLPLVVLPGSGSELYRGLGAVVLGGLVVSTVFTLVLVPALLSLVFQLQDRLGLLDRGEDRLGEGTG